MARADPSSALANAWSGARAIAHGPRIALRHGDVLLLCGAASAVYSLVWAIALWQAATWDQDVARWLVPGGGAAWWEQALQAFARACAYVLVWFAAVAVAAPLGLPMCAPVFSLLAERTEKALTGRPPPSLSFGALAREAVRGLLRGLAIGVVQLAGTVIIGATAFVAGLVVPPAGAALSAVLAPCWNALGLSAMALSFALDNHQCRLAEQLTLLQTERARLVGFGLAGLALGWIPLLMPLVVVAGTALALQLHGEGKVRFGEDGR
ncbi:MAG: EI24 domain-containing protein [Deltaproteobacteria bacterium]|nr:EI24 domain-containing protein [Deltaproteobacteria bacterium]